MPSARVSHAKLLLLSQRLNLGLDARKHILRRVLWLPANGASTVGAAARVRPAVPARLLAAEVLDELLDSEWCRFGLVGQAELDQSVANGFADLVPAVLAVFTKVEAFPTMPRLVWGVDDRVK